MNLRTSRHERRLRRPERGAAAAETAILLPVFCLLIFGAVEYGLMFRTVLTFSEATRSAARVVAALPRTAGYQDAAAHSVESVVGELIESDSITSMVVYKADPDTGLPSSGDPETCSTNCWHFTWNSTTRRFDVQGGSSWPATSQRACGAEASTDYVGVYVKGRHEFITGLFEKQRVITERAVMRLEPVAPSETCQ